MSLADKIELRFKNDLSKCFDDMDIKMYWFVKFEEYNFAFNGCALRVRYIDTAYNDHCIDIDIWEKRMSTNNYTFKFIIKEILEHHNKKTSDRIKELDK